MPLSPDELLRIERFVAAYNALDDFLQAATNTPQTFRSAVDFYAKRHPWWRDSDTLRTFAVLRNFLVHEKLRPYEYPCVPTPEAVVEIEAIRDRLLHPRRALPAFEREVVTLAPSDTLKNALKLIATRGHSRFPVFEGRHFRGLLTEGGITRFLAAQLHKSGAFDLQTPLSEVLPRETRRPTFRFVAPAMIAAEVAFAFHENTFLEAVLITENGREDGILRGIVTRGDVADLL